MGYSPNFFGTTARGSARSLQTNFQNGTLNPINACVPVSLNGASSQMVPTDISSEVSVNQFLGLTAIATPSGANGLVANSGRLENAPITGFSPGDPVYIGPGGTLIKTKPDLTVAGFQSGYFVIFVGVVVKNEFNSSNLDIVLMPEVIGQL